MRILSSPKTNLHFLSCCCQFAMPATAERRMLLRSQALPLGWRKGMPARQRAWEALRLMEGRDLCFPTYFLLKLRPAFGFLIFNSFLCSGPTLHVVQWLLGALLWRNRRSWFLGLVFPSEARTTSIRNASAFWEIRNNSVLTALVLMQKYEIQRIPSQCNHCLLSAVLG